jgi:arylsulfatase A-like enzyme
VRRRPHGTDNGSAHDRSRGRQPTAPRGTPNVLYIVWDDASIATWDAFGGLAETPAMKWLAGRGLRYSQWHTNALPSPTRCCLLTGRNAEPPGRRGQSVIIRPEAGTLAEILGRNGYRSYCVGQWHHRPQPGAGTEPRTRAGSRRNWPLGRGFDRYYGFLGPSTSPWYPDLVYDNQHVDPPYPPADGYHLSRDLADMAMEFIREGPQSEPGRPWLCYLSFGTSGVPQATPREWADRYRGQFDMGYDRYREVVLGNMKRLGIVPESTMLTPAERHPEPGGLADGYLARPWRSLTEDQRQLSSRLAESSAGLCSYTDHQVGRLLLYLQESGQLDDTIVVVCSANAASAGDRTGDATWTAGGPGRPGEALSEGGFLAGWPGPAGNAASGGGQADDGWAGWAWAFRTPYNVPRQDSLGGSAASPLIISWPGEMEDVAGGVRDQYHHAVDVVPTILECADIDLPQTIKAHVQAPLHGVSMRYTFTAPDAPSARRTQLYQMPGARAIYHDGWKAATGEGRAGADGWELYHVRADRAEIRNVAARYPEKVAELASLWEAAASRDAGPLRESRPAPDPLAGPWPPRPGRPPARVRCLDTGTPGRPPAGARAGAGASQDGGPG